LEEEKKKSIRIAIILGVISVVFIFGGIAKIFGMI
jgi:hypothetical protein